LARCFEGVEHPGQLKWTTTVEPTKGSVTDPSLEPLLDTADLTSAQRQCALDVLREPRYTLPPDAGLAGPQRVGVVVEF
jgi:hypothetical protein